MTLIRQLAVQQEVQGLTDASSLSLPTSASRSPGYHSCRGTAADMRNADDDTAWMDAVMWTINYRLREPLRLQLTS